MLQRRTFLMGAVSASAAAGDVAADYVRLVLAVGLHDPDYVDAYYGPPEWKEAVAQAKPANPGIRGDAEALLARVEGMPAGDELATLRRRFLSVQTRSLLRRLEMLEGKRFSFDDESKLLYDAVAPVVPESRFDAVLAELDRQIPGSGPLAQRYEASQKRFFIPASRLPAVFDAAVAEARERTRRHIRLPAGESFRVEYVKDQVWSAYNWYKGKAHSLIQVNTDLPVEIGNAVHLAAHEGYPGHHVYNALLEDRLVNGRGWREYTVYPLYSPQSLIAEGSAEYGVELSFPEEERIAFYEKTLFPLAGLDPAGARAYQRIRSGVERLKHAGNQAARRYLDGAIDRDACRDYLVRYALYPPDRAAQRVRFIEKNRSYVINYNVGQDMVGAYIERRGGGWTEFEKLLSSPRLPSGLV